MPLLVPLVPPLPRRPPPTFRISTRICRILCSLANLPRTPGHEVEENVNKAEGEVESSAEATEATAPEATAKTPSAAPQAAEETKEEAKAAEPLPEAEKDTTIQDTVDKTQASKTGHIGSVDGEPEGSSKS